jgi:outer membrane receptor protein involved in Fe transport
MRRKAVQLRLRLVTCAVIALLGSGLAVGQSIQYGNVTGTVLMPDGATMPGATVTLTSSALVSGRRSTTTSDRGTFVFLSLPPGSYTLSVGLMGFKTYTEEGVQVSAGSTASRAVTMELGEVTESVAVIAKAPTIDTKSSTISTTFNENLLATLPTARDAFYDLALTAPGISSVGSDESWLPSPAAYGTATNENVFLVNGVNTTNPRGSSWGSLVNVNYNTVEEVRVLSLGTKAEYGSFTGAAIDVITKSGGNEFHGNLSYYEMLKAWDNQPSGTHHYGRNWLYSKSGDALVTKPSKDWEANATLGGPILKDKIWFYAGYARNWSDIDTPIFEPLKEYRDKLFDIKVTSELAASHRLWFAYHAERPSYGNESWGDTWDSTMIYNQHRVNDTMSAQYQWFASDRNLVSMKYLGFQTDDEPTIPSGTDHPGYINWWKWDSYGVGGAFPYVEAQKSKRSTLQADLTHYAEEFLGSHDLKFGVQYTRAQGDWMGGYFQGFANLAYPVPESRSIADMQAAGFEGFELYVRQETMNPYLTVRKSESKGFFVDDEWVLNKRLTLNLGLRYDQDRAWYGKGKVYAQPDQPNDINDPPATLRSRQGTGNVFDFKNWSPRIGATWSVTADNRTVLRANFGRYFAPLSLENLRRFGPDMPAKMVLAHYYSIPYGEADTNGDGEIDNYELRAAVRTLPGRTPYETQDWGEEDQSWQLQVMPGTNSPRTDQLTVSLAREIASDIALEATFIYKRTSNLLVNWPINRETKQAWEWERVPFTTSSGKTVQVYSIVLRDYNGDGKADFDDVQFILHNTDLRVQNMPEIDGRTPGRTYRGVQLTLTKRYSNRWQALASLVYSDSDGVAPRTTDQSWYIDGPMIMDTPFVASPNQLVNNTSGPLPMTPKWQFKLSTSYTVPKVEVDLGLRYRYNSGRAVWPMDQVPSYQTWDSDFMEGYVISTGGETGGNIIAIDPDNPEYLPAEHLVDLSLSHDFKLGKVGSVGFSLDILNLFNSSAVNKAGFKSYEYGRVYSLVAPRVARLGVAFRF